MQLLRTTYIQIRYFYHDDDDDDEYGDDDDHDDDDDDDRSGDPPPPPLASDACVGHLIHAQPPLHILHCTYTYTYTSNT